MADYENCAAYIVKGPDGICSYGGKTICFGCPCQINYIDRIGEVTNYEVHTIGKHEEMDVYRIPDAISGACFHGEVWMKCPHCGRAHEMVGWTPFAKRKGFRIYKCNCGKLFKIA